MEVKPTSQEAAELLQAWHSLQSQLVFSISTKSQI